MFCSLQYDSVADSVMELKQQGDKVANKSVTILFGKPRNAPALATTSNETSGKPQLLGNDLHL